jgi:hypothetical protein
MKTMPRTRAFILTATLIAAFTSGIAQAKTVKLIDYFYPAQEGATWTYDGTDWYGYRQSERITMINSKFALNLLTGRKNPKSYRKDVLRFKFEVIDEYEWYEYFGRESSFAYYGMDEGEEQVRLDGGLVFPATVTVGKTCSTTADYYENGKSLGEVTYSVRVIDTLPVTVKAGKFPDCVHLLFTATMGKKTFFKNDAWWAKGIGVIKKRDVGEKGTRKQELVSSTLKTGPEITIQQPKGSNLVDGVTKKSFGTIALGKTGPTKPFTIKNTGTTKLKVLAARKDGSHAGDFIITTPVKATLAPGTSTTFKVRFKPAAEGPRTAILHILSNDADENPFDITLTGQGVK